MHLTVEDPHFLPGGISGSGMQETANGRVVDTRYAVRLDYLDGCLIEDPTPGNPMFAFVLAGTINDSDGDRARCVYLFPPEGASLLIDRILTLSGIVGPDFTRRLLERIQRLAEEVRDPDLQTENPLAAEHAEPQGPDEESADIRVA